MSRRPLLTLLAIAAWLGLAVACMSPTLPLPPPSEPNQIQPTATDGLWEIRGNCTGGAVVLIQNERTGLIVGFEDAHYDGRYTIALAAERCDGATVSEIVGDELSEATPFIVLEVIGGVPQGDCSGGP